MRASTSRFLLLSLVAIAAAGAALGQGRDAYFNVESPQVHPIEVATIDGHDVVLAVNTPANALEIWDTDESLPRSARLLASVPVGLEPVSVRWVPEVSRAYVANFLGDSISQIFIGPSDGALPVEATLVATTEVTDEPLDLAFVGAGAAGFEPPTVVVTHMSLDAVDTYHALTMQRLGAPSSPAVVDAGADLDFDGQLDEIALKEPRTAAVGCDSVVVLGHKGGNTPRYDFDVYFRELAGGATRALAGLGSHNANMAFGPDGTLYVVGGRARNTLRDEASVAAAATGFVRSMLFVVPDPCAPSPTVLARDINRARLVVQPIGPQPQATAGGLAATGGAIQPQPAAGPVSPAQALAQPVDVIAFEDGGTTKVFVAAFSSDRLGVIEPDAATAPLDWPIRRIAVVPQQAPIAGPRGLALGSEPGGAARLYVLNRVDNSIAVVDPVQETLLETIPLDADPTPDRITAGRRFLYDATLSGNGFVSCSSCHVDGRTDGLAWDLGDGNAVPIPRELMPSDSFSGGLFPADKEFMVTQSLQGLLNWEVDRDSQELFTNAPYHWRGDREDFLAFNGAFASLLGGSTLPPGDMIAFEDFVNSINYPPNPKQPRNRVYSGALGDPDDNDFTQNVSGDGGLLGLKIYHVGRSDGTGPCAGCHRLPVGSDNVLSEFISGVNPHPLPTPPLAAAPGQPMETSALRMLFQKEARRDVDGSSFPDDSPITGYEGLFHTGLTGSPQGPDFNGTATMNAFNRTFFSGRFCNPGETFCANLQGLNQYLQEFDTGTGPMIGRAHTVTLDTVAAQETLTAFKDVETQAEAANSGGVAHLTRGSSRRGFWYDVSASPPVWREEPGSAAFDRQDLLDEIVGTRDRMVVAAVPLGSERRIAHPDGTPAPVTGDAPTNVTLQPMATNTANADVPSLTLMWEAPSGNGNPAFGGTHSHTVRVYQYGLVNDAPTPAWGVCGVRHEAPRRFRVSGKGLRHGAELHLFVQDDPAAGPPDPALGPEDPGQVGMRELVLPLHPTASVSAEGRPIFETAVEMEARLFLRLMAGRPDQAVVPGTLVALNDIDFLLEVAPENQPGLFDPASWNLHYVRVVNEDGTAADGGWQPLTIEPGPDCP